MTYFSSKTIAAMIMAGVLAVIIPAAALIVYRKKAAAARLSDFFTGGGVFIVFALVLEQLLHTVMLPAVSGSKVLYVVYGALAAGVFEETGRFVAFKTLMKDRESPQNAVMYGIGHGGFEAVILLGISMFGAAVTAVMTNSIGLEAMIDTASNGDPGLAQTARLQLDALASYGFGNAFLSVFERVLAMTFHISLSVLVFESARGKIWLFPVCILIHALLDVPAAMYQVGALPAGALYGSMLVFDAAAVFAAVKSYGRLKSE